MKPEEKEFNDEMEIKYEFEKKFGKSDNELLVQRLIHFTKEKVEKVWNEKLKITLEGATEEIEKINKKITLLEHNKEERE